MRHPGVVWGVCLEANREDIVAVVARDVEVFGARLVVAEVQGGQLELRNMLRPQESEAMKLLAGFGVLREIGHSFGGPFGGAPEHLGGSWEMGRRTARHQVEM